MNDDGRHTTGRFDPLEGVDQELTGTWSGKPVEEILRAARQAQEEYDFETARQLFRIAVQRGDFQEDVVCELAGFLVDDYGQFEEAVGLLTSSECRLNNESLRLLARAYFTLGMKPEALDAYRRLHERGLGDGQSLLRAGRILLEMSLWQEAVKTLEEALALSPADQEAQEARRVAEEGVEREMGSILERAEASLDEGDLDAARAHLDGVGEAEYKPRRFYHLEKRLQERSLTRDVEALRERACQLALEDRPSEAITLYRQLVDLSGGDSAAEDRIRELNTTLQRQELDQALVRVRALEDAGQFSDAVVLLGTTVTRFGRDLLDGLEGGVVGGWLRQWFGQKLPAPTTAQAQALASLSKALEAVEGGDLEAAQVLYRSLTGLEGFELFEGLKRAIDSHQRKTLFARAESWLRLAIEEETAGHDDAAAELYEKAAAVQGFPLAGKARTSLEALRGRVEQSRRQGALRKWVGELVEQSRFFPALRELEKHRELFEGQEFFRSMEAQVLAGIQSKYPLETTVFEDELGGAGDRTHSSRYEIRGVDAEKARVLNTSPWGDHIFVLANGRLVALNARTMNIEMQTVLPDVMDVVTHQGFVLVDRMPGDRYGLWFVNWDEDLLMTASYRRRRLQIENAFPINANLLHTKQKVSRWFAASGLDDRLLVCQSSPGAGSGSHLYSLSLQDGKMVQEERFGYALSNLRGLSGEPGQYVVHRHPEPMQMRKSSYFSFAFMDSRFRVTRRFHIPAKDLDGTFIESTRWIRTSRTSGRTWMLTRYFDAYTGQLVGRPYAFLALGADNELLYAASDSSTLVRGLGDLDGMGELLVKDGREFLVLSVRKSERQILVTVDAETFKVVDQFECDGDDAVVALSVGKTPDVLTALGVHRKEGWLTLHKRPL